MRPEEWLYLHEQGPDWQLLEQRFASSLASDLCKHLLTYREFHRPTAQQALQHAWLASRCEGAVISAQTLASLVAFRRKDALQKTVCLQVATQLSSRQTKGLDEVFTRLADQAGQPGVVPCEALAGALVDLGLGEGTAHEVVKGLDLDQSGTVDYSEFLAGCVCEQQSVLAPLLQQSFQSFDVGKTGWLNKEDLRTLLASGPWLPEDADALLRRLDTDGDGRVCFAEFRAHFAPPAHRVEFVDQTGVRVEYRVAANKTLEYWKDGRFKRTVDVLQYCRGTRALTDVKRGLGLLSWTGKAHIIPLGRQDDVLTRLRGLCELAGVTGLEREAGRRCTQMWKEKLVEGARWTLNL